MVLVSGGLVRYGPQEGWPAILRRSCGAGGLCRLRECVGAFARVGAAALPRVTMGRSDSLIAGESSLSLLCPSRLALAVSAAGALRASQVPVSSFFTCHVLRPRRIVQSLTFNGFVHVGCRHQDAVPTHVCQFRG